MKVALVIWGNSFEFFFDTLKISREEFLTNFTGSWQFGYVKGLKEAGYEPTIYYVSERVNKITRRHHEPSNCNVCFIPSNSIYKLLSKISNTPGNKISGLETITSYFATPMFSFIRELSNCKAVIVQEYEYARFDLLTLICNFLKVPIYGTFQGGNKTLSILEQPFRNWSLKNSTGLIVASRIERQRLINKGINPNKIYNIPNALDFDVYPILDKSQCRQELHLDKNLIYVVWHGRIDYIRKGLDKLLNIWNRIENTYTQDRARLLLIGDGSDTDILRKQIRDLNLKQVYFINRFISDKLEIKKYLSACNIYCFTSRNEGFPVAPIEALGCGLHLISFETDGIEDIIFPDNRSSFVAEIIRSNGSEIDIFAKRLNEIIKSTESESNCILQNIQNTNKYFSVDSISVKFARLFN